MSTAPQGWQNPKVSWQPADVVSASDLVRIESNINAIETGTRTLDPAQVPTGNDGSLRQILSWLANRIRAITGATNWWDAPAATIATIWGKFHQSAGHKHTGAASDAPPIPISGIDSAAKTSAGGSEANRLAVTDGSGRVGRAITADQLGGVNAANYARKDQSNVFTQRQTFAAGIQDGDANADVSFLYSLGIPMHSRSLVVTAWSPKGTPTQFQIKNGSTVMATITLTLNAKEKPTKAVAVFNIPDGGTVTITVTQTFENDTKFISRTRTVTVA